jgi:hypothetical protein
MRGRRDQRAIIPHTELHRTFTLSGAGEKTRDQIKFRRHDADCTEALCIIALSCDRPVEAGSSPADNHPQQSFG